MLQQTLTLAQQQLLQQMLMHYLRSSSDKDAKMQCLSKYVEAMESQCSFSQVHYMCLAFKKRLET